MPPVQPSPTMTTSTSLSFVVMARPSTHISDADGLVRERFAAILLHVIAMHGDHSGETDQRPARFVAIAAVDRVGKHALHDGLIERAPKHAHRQSIIESDCKLGQADSTSSRCAA